MMNEEEKERNKRILDLVLDAAKKYWAGYEPVTVESAWIDERLANGDMIVRVEWVSDITRDIQRDDMIYTVSELDDGTLNVFGPS
jgi:hypothetical protein